MGGRQIRSALQAQLAAALGAHPSAVAVTRVSAGGACLNLLPVPPWVADVGSPLPGELADRLYRQLQEEGSRIRSMTATRIILVVYDSC